jgi:amino acid transporter
MPTMLAFINIDFFTPIVAVLFMVITKNLVYEKTANANVFVLKSFATLICLLFQDVFVLLNMGVLAEYLCISCSVFGLLWLRKKQPLTQRPIKVKN